MQHESNPIDAVFKKIDVHAEKIQSLQLAQGEHHGRISHIEKKQDELCRLLIQTDTRVMESIGTISRKQDVMIAEQNRAEGAKSALRAVPILIGVVVALLQIVILTRSFK